MRVAMAEGMRFVKRPSANLRARVITELAGITAAEVRFYQELAQEISEDIPLRIPRFTRAHHRPWDFELVIEDLVSAGCRLIRPGDVITPDQAEHLLRVLAAMHAKFWEDRRLDHELRWLTDLHRREVMLGERLGRPLMEIGLLRAGSLVPRELHPGARRYASNRARMSQHLGRGPRTVVHHDCHPGNLFWTPEGEPGLLDWQLVRCGSWASDVAYLLATGLTPPDRREHGDELLEGYLAQLPQEVRPSLDDARQSVRGHMAYAFEAMILTLAVGGLMEKHDIRRLVHRTAIAVLDNQSFEVLGL